MAQVFLYGPYSYVSDDGMPAGADHYWWFGPWSWYADAITVTAHPLALEGADRRLSVTAVSVEANANGDRMLYATVHNDGPDSANYAIWIGGVSP
jgi:hypothetical protein